MGSRFGIPTLGDLEPRNTGQELLFSGLQEASEIWWAWRREDRVPERKPDFTPSGKATVKKMTKLERSDVYLTLVCGHLLATIKEALAVTPQFPR